MDVNLNKCRLACNLILAAMSNDEHADIKLDYYHELCKLIDANKELINENEKLKRENCGLKQTNTNLKISVEKMRRCLGWR